MPQILRADLAKTDLAHLWVEIAEAASEVIADRHLARIEKRLRLLADFPYMGTACHEYGKDMRCFPVRRQVIFYRPIADGIQVLRVLHGARDFPSIFGAG